MDSKKLLKHEIINRDIIYSDNPKWLLNYCVRKLIANKKENEYLNSIQLANTIFGNKKHANIIQIMLNDYKKNYFISDSRGCRPNLDKLRKDHSDIFQTNMNESYNCLKNKDLDISLCVKSLDDEIKESYNANNKYISLKNLTLLSGTKFIYLADIDKNDDEVIQLPEGVKMNCLDDNKSINVIILEYNQQVETVSFECNTRLSNSKVKLQQDISFINKKLKEILTDSNLDLLLKKVKTSNGVSYLHQPIFLNLDKPQGETLEYALAHSTTYVWGPPGTGKSHLLAATILNLSLSKERTLVCSTANVAVNNLTNKYLDLVESYKNKNHNYSLKKGESIRIGYVSDEKLKRNDLIFPEENTQILSLRQKIQKLENRKNRLKGNDNENERSKVISLIIETEKSLDDELKKYIHQANVVFCTASRAILDNSIRESKFDNIIVDEGSMMAIPNLLAIIQNVSKRIIIAGDFRQLGPIALSSSNASAMWLHNDLFYIIDPDQDQLSKHECIKMLTMQRRSDKDIIKYSNKFFYENKLETKKGIGDGKAYPIIQKDLRSEFIDLTLNPNYKCERTKEHSRRNKLSKDVALSILHEIQKVRDIRTVGIITPYNGQCSFYKRTINKNSNLFTKFNIKIGTVHTFQGSECDVIIYDMVDSIQDIKNEEIPVGNLYYGKNGEKLINVAFSRAIRKLIVIGCSRVLKEGLKSELVSTNTKKLINELIDDVRSCKTYYNSNEKTEFNETDLIKPLDYYMKQR